MQTKLTLRLDAALIAKAKSWAKEHGVSLSDVVAGVFAQLTQDQSDARLSAWTLSLAGAASAGSPSPTDESIRADYRAHVERNHS